MDGEQYKNRVKAKTGMKDSKNCNFAGFRHIFPEPMVPVCSGCAEFGSLSHPLIPVHKAVESIFRALC